MWNGNGTQRNNVQGNVENLDEGNETDSDDELVRNSIIEPRLDRSVRGRGQTRNRRGQRGHERGVVRRVNANSRFRNR